MFKVIGYEVIYPNGCSDIESNLRPDELRKRINELNAALRDLLRQTGLTDESMEAEPDIQRTCGSAQEPIQLTGLLLHLLSPQFTHHPDLDIRLRICVAVCSLLKLFCPTNPFEAMCDCQNQIKNLLRFLTESISNLCNLHSKHAVNYPRLFTIIYNCCKLDIFAWCRLLDDGDKCLLSSLKTLLSITKNINIWAWSDEATVQQFILNTLVTLIHQSVSLLTDQVVAYLISFLIEPAKSSQPVQHAIVKDLIVRAAPQLEYPIQMLIQNSLVTSDHNSTENEPTSHDLLGEHTFIVIYALYTLKESLVAPILPCIDVKLKSNNARERKRAFRLLTRIFAEPSSTAHHKYPELWTSFLTRFQDIDSDVRSFCIQMAPIMLKQNKEIPKESLLDCVKSCTLDKVESVRLGALKTVITIMHESKDSILYPSLFDIVHHRSRDKALSVRKEALFELAHNYKRNLQTASADVDRMSVALNTIMHMYYQPDNEDKIAVERLFKSCVVPYDFGTKERVEGLFKCYQLADDATIKSIQELLKIQFTGSTLMREALRIVVGNQGRKIVGQASAGIMQRLQKLAGLLPKSDKALDHLKKFFNAVHTDRALRTNCLRLFHPECSSTVAVQCIRGVLKRVQQQPASSAVADSSGAYERTIKLLLERCSSVLFDEAFGQELLTRLVIFMDTDGSLELTKGLRILLALSVYHKDVLPADDVLQYVGNVLNSPKSHQNENICYSGSGVVVEKDASTAVELCLQILCCLLGGGPIYQARDSKGAPTCATILSSEVPAGAENEAKKKSQSNMEEEDDLESLSHGRLFSGSTEQLFDQASNILPLLFTFCTTGLTYNYPPIEHHQPASQTRTQSQLAKGQRRKKGAKDDAIEKADEAAKVEAAGLAWRRERRRAKLAMRVLRQLLTVAHDLAGKSSSFPRGPVSSLNNTHEEAPGKQVSNTDEAGHVDAVDAISDADSMAKLEQQVQQHLNSIVKTCLACEFGDANYIACLTSLSHVGLLFPGLYNPQLKTLMTSHLIPNLLTRDPSTPSDADQAGASRRRSTASKKQVASMLETSEKGTPADWIPDGCVPLLTRAKIAAVKLMANWLVGLKLHNKQVAQVIIRLLHRIIVHDGDLTCHGNMSHGDMSRMRLVAATSWLKIAHQQIYVEVIEVLWYQSMSYVMCDPCAMVRSQFLAVLHNGLLDLKLPLEYMAMFVHAAETSSSGVDSAFRLKAKQCLLASVKRRRAFLARHASLTDNPKLLFALLPDFVLAYAIHLLAHDPDWRKPSDVRRLGVVKSSLWFIMEPIMAGGNNYTFLRQLLEKIKHSQDALCPDDQDANEKMYMACDIALGLLLTRSTNIVWKGCQVDIKLPRTLFLRAPPDFSNPDFAQLGGGAESATPLITFTPLKNSKAVKDGLIPAKFIRIRGSSHKQQQLLAPVASPSKSNSDSDTDKDNDDVGGDNVDLDENSEKDSTEEHSTSSVIEDAEIGKNTGTDGVTKKRRNSVGGADDTTTKRPKPGNDDDGDEAGSSEIQTNGVATKADSKSILKQAKLLAGEKKQRVSREVDIASKRKNTRSAVNTRRR